MPDKDNRSPKHRRIYHIMSGFSSLLCTAFIWSNSLKNATESGTDSGRVLSWLNKILEAIGLEPFLTSHLVRKCAHFSEFALLGVLLTLTCLTARRRLNPLYIAAPVSLAIACTDELLQLFSPGRACQVTDMLLDLCGALTGIGLIMLIYVLIRKVSSAHKPLNEHPSEH